MPIVTWSQVGCLPWLILLMTALAFEAPAQDGELGKRVFTSGTEPSCALCHTLAAAGASGEIGPNLDELKPTEDRVRRAVERGVGNMPAFNESLSDAQIAAVSQFVADAVR